MTSRLRILTLIFLVCAGSVTRASAELQFDIFLGYDSIVREASWFPIGIEVFNDGPSFNATIEIATGGFGADQVREVPIELPTNTRKRLTIPIFSSGSRFGQWDVRLVDERGKVRADRSVQSKPLVWEGILLGAMPRAFTGAPVFPDTAVAADDRKPQVARLQPDMFPDNPITLEGLNALYLNSEKAITLKVNQIGALLAWIRQGGHLIFTVEQITDVNATPWLQQLLPCDLTDTANLAIESDLLDWLSKNVPSQIVPPASTRGRRTQASVANPAAQLGQDPAFGNAQVPVATGTLRAGVRTVVATQGKPLILQGNHGRGKITVLTFSPEREPFRSWKNKPWFWARIAEVPPELFVSSEFNSSWGGGWSIDGVFGALIDSRQEHKVPIEALLLLLVVYLVVIGPFDRWWLKKINREMLTWITFPAYVVLFSLLIYFIGYKLRAGDTEWNELNLVDVSDRGDRTELRGRTYISVYSSANAMYPVASDQPFAMLRNELVDFAGGGRESGKAQVQQVGNSFKARITGHVWTSLLFANDWLQTTPESPLRASISQQPGTSYELAVENPLDRPLTDLRLVVNGFVHEIGTLAAQEKKTIKLDSNGSTPLAVFIQRNSGNFVNAIQGRRNAFGRSGSGHLENPSLVSTVASFCSKILPQQFIQQGQRSFVAPAGLDLSPVVDRGDAVLFAWDANHSLTQPINKFNPPRQSRNTLLRLAIPVGGGDRAL